MISKQSDRSPTSHFFIVGGEGMEIKELEIKDKQLLEHCNTCSICRNKLLSIMLHAGAKVKVKE